MRFPSLFRVPRHQKFNFEPRYYDPIKEEIQERTRRIEQELKGSQGSGYTPGNISFQRKAAAAPSSSMLQLVIAAILGSLVVGWLYYGDVFLNVLWLAIPVYLFFRLRGRFKRKG
jgi:hypothetical protein